MKKVVLILSLLFVVTTAMDSARQSAADGSYDTTAKMRALFLYNFTRYIEWPESYKQGSFYIGVLGETSSTFTTELDKMAATKKAVNQKIEIKHFNSASEISKCHMLYVAKEKSTELNSAISKTKDFSTLIVTEEKGFAKQGAGISFVVINNRQKFELNKGSIQTRNLIVGSSLLSLAIVVD